MSSLSDIAKEIEQLNGDLALPTRPSHRDGIFWCADSCAGKFTFVNSHAGTRLLHEILRESLELPLGMPLPLAFRIVAKRRVETLARALINGASELVPDLAADVRASGVYRTVRQIARP